MQSGNPTFGARFERGDVCCREVEAHDLVEKIGGFVRCEAQVGGAQFGQLAPGAQPGQRERRILAAGNDQPELRRQMIDKEGQRLVDRRGLDHVIIVEDEHRIAQRGEIVQQRRQQHIGRRRLRSVQRAQRRRSNRGRDGLQGRDEIRQKTREIVIIFVQREPRDG